MIGQGDGAVPCDGNLVARIIGAYGKFTYACEAP